MRRKEAEQIVIDAAQSWLTELAEYIIPASEAAEDGCDYQTGADRLEMALAIVNNELDASDFHEKDAGEFGRCPF